MDITEQITQPINIVNSSSMINKDSIMVDIEGLHAITTGNFTRYQPIALQESVPTWTTPYQKPVIMHHNEEDGKIIGRIHAVEYKTLNTRSNTPALVFTVNIPDPEGKKQIIDGRLLTTSVGINATDVRCSICNRNIAAYGQCEHHRGQTYDNEICYWDIYRFVGKELSYVITPSDPYAYNLKIYSPDGKNVDSNNIKEQQMLITENLDQGIEPATEPIKETVVDSTTEPATEPVIEQPAQEPESTPITPEPEVLASDTEPAPPEQDKLLDKVIELTNQVATLTEQLKNERSLRESLETTNSDLNSKYKIMLATTVNELRSKLGKDIIESAELAKRSELSLQDTISDYTKELSIKESQAADISNPINIVEGLQQIPNPAIVDDTKTETIAVSNINIKDEFSNLDKILFR